MKFIKLSINTVYSYVTVYTKKNSNFIYNFNPHSVHVPDTIQGRDLT